MSYNMSYTSLPTFTSNSIGYFAANSNNFPAQNFTVTNGAGSTSFNVFSAPNVEPGVYIFTCSFYIFPGYIPSGVNISNIYGVLFNSTQSFGYCQSYASSSSDLTLNFSQVFANTTPSSTMQCIVYYSYTNSNSSSIVPYNAYYSLVRIA